MKYKTSYTTLYNFRPDECGGMGKESLIVTSVIDEKDLLKFIQTLSSNSKMKFKDNIEYILGSDESFAIEGWTPWIGQPMFYVVDIQIEPIKNAVQKYCEDRNITYHENDLPDLETNENYCSSCLGVGLSGERESCWACDGTGKTKI